MAVDSMRDRFINVATELIEENERLALVFADISLDRFIGNGVLARHPKRVINVGIREQLMVNVAAGMALEGMRTIAHSFAPFLIERSYEQVKLAFSHQGVGGILVGSGIPYDNPAYGRTHQTAGDLALINTLPGWRIIVPGHPDEAEEYLRGAVATDDAVYIRLSDQRNADPHLTGDGRLITIRKGKAGAPTIIAIGPMLDAVTEAVAPIDDATVLYASTLRPFDAEGLRAAMLGTNVIIVEPALEGTSAAAVSTALCDRAHRLLSIGIPNVEHRKYGTAAQHDAAHGLDARGLRARIIDWLAEGI